MIYDTKMILKVQTKTDIDQKYDNWYNITHNESVWGNLTGICLCVCLCTSVESRPLSFPLKITQSATECAASSEEWIKNLITQAWEAVKRLTLQVYNYPAE